MANEWFYTKNGERFGPVSGQQLKELAAKGQLAPADLVWKEGMKQWLPAKNIKGLFDGVTASPPASAQKQPVETNPTPERLTNGSRPNGLMPVLITQTVIAAIGFLFGFWGIIELGPSDLRSLNGLFVCVAVGWNLGVLATTWLGFLQRSYWFSLLAARLMFGSWFFFLFTGCPIPVSVLGLMISIPVGIWAITTFRKPEVRAFLGTNSQPVDFSSTLLGPILGNKWAGFTGKQRAISIGAGLAALLLFVVVILLLQGDRSPRPHTPLSGSQFSKNDKPETASKPSDQEEEKLIQKADELWASGKKHEAADIYQSILDKHGGLYHGKAASSRVYSRTIDSLVERAGPGAVQNYIKMATIARVTLVLSNPETRQLAGDAAAKEQEFLTTPPDTGGGEVGGSASADQIARRNNAIASDLKSFTSEKDMRSTYGPPTAFHQSSIKKNACLIAWERTRQSGQKEFLAITYLRRLDGRDEPIIIHADVVPSLDRLKEMLNSKAVMNP